MTEEAVLPGGKSLDWVFQQIAEHNDSRATDAADEIIKTAGDRDLRSELIKLVTDYQKAKDSIEMHNAFEAIVRYTKAQYGLILVQGFRMGQGYQQKVANEAFKEILAGAATQAEKAASPKGEAEKRTESEN